jgi:hypothetical protein
VLFFSVGAFPHPALGFASPPLLAPPLLLEPLPLLELLPLLLEPPLLLDALPLLLLDPPLLLDPLLLLLELLPLLLELLLELLLLLERPPLLEELLLEWPPLLLEEPPPCGLRLSDGSPIPHPAVAAAITTPSRTRRGEHFRSTRVILMGHSLESVLRGLRAISSARCRHVSADPGRAGHAARRYRLGPPAARARVPDRSTRVVMRTRLERRGLRHRTRPCRIPPVSAQRP